MSASQTFDSNKPTDLFPQFIIKRDGSKRQFDYIKVREAIRKANEATVDEAILPVSLDALTLDVIKAIPAGTTPNVEIVQDLVEEALILAGYAKTAKNYILYRAEHAKIRQTQSDLMDIYQELTFAYAKDADIKRENANIDADTAMGTMLKYGSEGAKYFVDNYILPKDISHAHTIGDIHIHDKDFYLLTETCCQIDLIDLFKNGYSTGHGYLREPNSIASYSALACIAIQANQNEMHGGQSVPNFDYSMAMGVTKSFRKEYRDALTQYFKIKLDIDDKDLNKKIKQTMQALEIELDMQNTDAFGKAFIPAFLKQDHISLSQEQLQVAYDFAIETAIQKTDRLTYQAMEAFIHNLNTMNSRAGAQVPFSSINYGTCTTPEGRMVMKNLLLATESGLGNGETPIFPVQIFKVKEGISYNEGDPNYDLFQLAIRTSAKRLFPNFSFLDAPYNLEFYKEGDYDSEVAYMGCRTRVMANVYDKDRQVTSGRGNLSFSSINLPRIGIQSEGDLDKFYQLLDKRLELIFRQLLHRYDIQAKKKCRNYPFLMGQGIWLDSDTLGVEDTIGEILKHGTLSIGFIGLAETLVALTGKHHGESKESQQLGLDIITHMRKKIDEKSAEENMNFTLLSTPAEGLSGRFVRLDKEIFGEMEGITDKEYYTNSFHIPVKYELPAFEKIDIEAPYHALTNAGHISYVELDGDASKNLEAFETIIRYMKESGIGYGSINHPVDRDPVCGYTGIIDDVCPRCGRREGEEVSIETLQRLQKEYPNIPNFQGHN